MADESMSRDREIRSEALQASTAIVAAMVGAGTDVPFPYARALAHLYAHWIHSGVWFDFDDNDELVCQYGAKCRFNRVDAR